jgi:Contractile injection system tube protein
MPDTGLRQSPKFEKGALVQLVKGLTGVVPNVIPFQYNPEKLSHTLTPWNPFEVDQTQRGAQAPTVQPFDPKESFTLTLEIDATNDLEDDNPVAKLVGVADRLAALKKLTLPSEGLAGDLINSAVSAARALVGKAAKQAERPTVPVVLFVWGPGRILPVRVTSFSVEETLFLPSLHPIQATVTLGLEVLTPDVFKCQRDITADIAVAAYNFTRLQEDTLAAAHIANNLEAIRGLLPF